MKKRISFILAFLMAATMLAGCKKTNEDTSGLPDVGGAEATTSSLTQMTTTTEATTTTTETTTEETEETEETTETTTEASETSETSETSTAAAETMAEKSWSETEISESMYIKTACYSRVNAIVGSDAVKKYEAGTKIEVVAATDTGYYKLADGTFIHSDYVTDRAPAATTTAATTKKDSTTTAANPDNDKATGSTGSISSSYNKSYKTRYPYKQLNSAEQELYGNIVEAAENFNKKVQVPDGLLSDDIFKVYCIVYNNEPQLFWLSTSAPSGYGSITLDFALTKEEAEAAQKTIDANAAKVIKSVNGYSSTISKLKVIHDWVILNNDFSLQGTYATCSIYNGLTGNGAIQCQGYAKTTQYLCDLAGIECMTVVGNNTEGSTHAWNVVYCENGYYILDTTWDDPYNEKGYNKSGYIRYVLFLANDSMIKNTHLNQSTATRGNGTRVSLYTPPSCTGTSCYYFKAYNKTYDDLASAEQALYDEFDAVIKSGTQAVHIRVSDHDLWETLMSTDYAVAFQKYAKSKDSKISGIGPQRTLVEDINVVEFDIRYN